MRVTKEISFSFFREKNADLVTDALEFMYTPWPDNSDKYALRSQLIDLIGDYQYAAPSHEVADIHSKVAPVYLYEFAHRPKHASIFAEWMGVVHGENVPFAFGIPLWFPGYDAADKNVSMFIMAVYSNFAKPAIQHLSQLAVLRGRSTIPVTELTCESIPIPRWRQCMLLAEWHSGMITILN